ncbi:MAG: hypothetical protein V8R51_06625 [Clostridia bacterium]
MATITIPIVTVINIGKPAGGIGSGATVSSFGICTGTFTSFILGVTSDVSVFVSPSKSL